MNMDVSNADQAAPRKAGNIVLHDEASFVGMRKAGRLAAETLDFITEHVKPGVTTEELNQLCHDVIVGHQAIQLHGGMGVTEELSIGPAVKRIYALETRLGIVGKMAARLAAATYA